MDVSLQRHETPCKWCGTPTSMTHTRECDSCWELERRIRMDPDTAAKIMAAVMMENARERTPV